MSKQARAKARAAKPIQDAFRASHPKCWYCYYMLNQHSSTPEPMTLHHIAGRTHVDSECRENYAALCMRHHSAIQSRAGAEAFCLALKWLFDRPHYSPAIICDLRGKAPTWITEADVTLTRHVLAVARSCQTGETDGKHLLRH